MGENLRNKGHRERIREKFLFGDASSRSDEALLELLLTFAIPQRDVRPLARFLISHFGNLDNVLSANFDVLRHTEGLKDRSAVLLKLVETIKHRSLAPHPRNAPEPNRDNGSPGQPGAQGVFSPLLEPTQSDQTKVSSARHRKPVARYGSELFGKAVLKEAIEMLPRLPDSENIDDIRAFLRGNLHFSAEQTRKRYANYITRRMFPEGIADATLRHFARAFPASTELRDVCYYRFCKAEPLMTEVISSVFLPVLGLGRIRRERITRFLHQRFSESKSISDCVQAIVDALSSLAV